MIDEFIFQNEKFKKVTPLNFRDFKNYCRYGTENDLPCLCDWEQSLVNNPDRMVSGSCNLKSNCIKPPH